MLGKLRLTTSGLSELLEHDVLSELLDSLFPRNNRPDLLGDWSNLLWSDEWKVSLEEINEAIKRGSSSLSKAPGPDGFRLILWKRVPEVIRCQIKHIFNLCLKSGEFPNTWKRANLVLIPKIGNPNTGMSDTPKARPIYVR